MKVSEHKPLGVSHLPNFGAHVARLRGFDKSRDVAEVVPAQAVNLSQAYLNAAVPSDINAEETQYNHIEDPSAILDRPRDQFDAMSQQAGINDYLAAKAQSDGENGGDQ